MNSLRLAVSKLHTKKQMNQAIDSLLQVSEQVCRDMYGDDVVDQGPTIDANDASDSSTDGNKKKTSSKKKKEKKKRTRTKSTGRK